MEVVTGADGRNRLMVLMPEGRAKRAEAQKVWNRAQLAMNERLGTERVVRLHELLDECMALLNELDGAAPPDDAA